MPNIRNAVLNLKSPVGADFNLVFEWPQGDSYDRFSEDELAQEIWETFATALPDHPELDFVPPPLPTSASPASSLFRVVENACECWNDAVRRYVDGRRFRTTKATLAQAQHIITQVYNQAVDCPEQLNQYSAFSPNVYGETSPKMVSHIISQLDVKSDDVFLDLGSGVGQVVLQMAAAADFKLCVGIETSQVPCGIAVGLEREFRKTMAWYGKHFSKIQLLQGDFLQKPYRPVIQQATVIFANNFAFGPEVDHQLKNIFADLPCGVRIISSKEFSAINFRINDRNLSDIGAMMNVSVMQPFEDAVSWTNSKVSFFLHVIDQKKLARYFEAKLENNSEDRQTVRRQARKRNGRYFNCQVNGRWNEHECYDGYFKENRANGYKNVQKVPSSSNSSWEEVKEKAYEDQHGKIGSSDNEPNCVESLWPKEEPISEEDVPLSQRAAKGKQKRLGDSIKRSQPRRSIKQETISEEDIPLASRNKSKKNKKANHVPSSRSWPGNRAAQNQSNGHRASKSSKNARKKKKPGKNVEKITQSALPSQRLVNGVSSSHADPYADAPWRNIVPSSAPKSVDELLANLRVGYNSMLEAMTRPDYRDRLLEQIDAEKERNARLRGQVDRYSKHIAELRESGVKLLQKQMAGLDLNPEDADSVDRCAGELIQRHFELQQACITLKQEVAALEKITPPDLNPADPFSGNASQPKKRLRLLSEVNRPENEGQHDQSVQPTKSTAPRSTDVCKVSPYDLLPKKRWR